MRVLITRPKEQAGELAAALLSIRAEPVYLPTIKVTPVEDSFILDRSLQKLDCYEWLIFTSANAVEVVFDRLVKIGIENLHENLRIAVIGPATAASLEKRGITPNFMPDEYIVEAITPGLGDLRGGWVLLPTADIAHDTLPKAIQAAGGCPHVVTAYHTVPADPDPDSLSALRSGVDVITFTSGSTVQNFHRIVQEAGLDVLNLPGGPKIACIGPKTTAAAERIGYCVDIQPETYTVQGLVKAINQQVVRNDQE